MPDRHRGQTLVSVHLRAVFNMDQRSISATHALPQTRVLPRQPVESEDGRTVWGKEAKAEQGGDGCGRQMGHRGSGGSEEGCETEWEAGNESGACYPGTRMNHAENEMLSHCDSE